MLNFDEWRLNMDLDYSIDRLSKNRWAFESLVKGASPEQVRWKPSPDKWSMLEVINHLYDEEREDFRARLEPVLADPRRPLSPIDPGIGLSHARTTKEILKRHSTTS